MVPVRVPIIDYENPFYCPHPRQFHLVGASDTDSHVDRSTSSSRKSAATPAYKHRDAKNRRSFKTEARSPRIHAPVRGPKRVTKNDRLGGPRVAVGRKSAYDSSPCTRLSSSLRGGKPDRKRARYATPSKGHISPGIPSRDASGDKKQHRSVKQECSSPVLLASLDQDERKHQVPKEGSKKLLVSALKDIVTTQRLLLRLDEVFPQIGFKEAVDSVQHASPEADAEYRCERHQALVDLLGERGALNEFVLTALRDAEFRALDLGPTMRGVNKLDLPRGDVMHVFSQPEWFKNLKTLSFAGGHFQDDFDLTLIRPCNQIESLVLADTGIGNEGVFHIVALKRKLRHLDLSGNPSINDDSIPALILLHNLQYLSVFGTGIMMPGLRKLAVAVKEGERVVDIKIPSTCKDYMDHTMHNQYLLRPASTLISSPLNVDGVSKTAPMRNAEAYAAVNGSIFTTGPRNEMEERRRKILEVRNLDIIVREMLLGPEMVRGQSFKDSEARVGCCS